MSCARDCENPQPLDSESLVRESPMPIAFHVLTDLLRGPSKAELPRCAGKLLLDRKQPTFQQRVAACSPSSRVCAGSLIPFHYTENFAVPKTDAQPSKWTLYTPMLNLSGLIWNPRYHLFPGTLGPSPVSGPSYSLPLRRLRYLQSL